MKTIVKDVIVTAAAFAFVLATTVGLPELTPLDGWQRFMQTAPEHARIEDRRGPALWWTREQQAGPLPLPPPPWGTPATWPD
jgi:hypothetical protein